MSTAEQPEGQDLLASIYVQLIAAMLCGAQAGQPAVVPLHKILSRLSIVV